MLVCHEQVFRPDRLNAFEVQTEADAMLERQRRDILPGLTTPKTPGEKRLVTYIFTGVRIRGCNKVDAVIGHSIVSCNVKMSALPFCPKCAVQV